MPTVGSRLRSLRESVKLSQAKLGALAGLKQASVNRYEHDLAQAPHAILLWYAGHFDVSMDYIFARCDKPAGPKIREPAQNRGQKSAKIRRNVLRPGFADE